MLSEIMRNFTAVVERDPATGLFVGSVPGWAGAHSQGATFDELQANLREVIEMLLEDGEQRARVRRLVGHGGAGRLGVCFER
jgi:predicted RNase H-like HicB family nuclease